jgi:predicted amidohydrolase YtcJ
LATTSCASTASRFADGALGPQTALMIDPYEGSTGNRGISTLDKEEMFENVRKASAAGLSSTIHAIGDKANHDVLDVFAMVRAEEQQLHEQGNTRLRHRIEHVQLLHPDDFNRLAQLDVIASMQPIHATSDMLMADVGATQRGAYARRTQTTPGGLAFGPIRPSSRSIPSWGFTPPSRAAAPMEHLRPKAGTPSSASR